MLIKWEELAKNDFDARNGDNVVGVCFSSIEQHASHLPVGTDTLLGASVIEEAARRAVHEIIVLPQVCYGYSSHHKFAKGYITINQRVLVDYAKNIAASVYENGFRKLVFVNSHGGNKTYLAAAVNELGEEIPGLKVVFLQYWDLERDVISQTRLSTRGGMGHAGEFETGLMMYLYPSLVQVENIQEVPPVVGDDDYSIDLVDSIKKYYRYISFDYYNQDGMIGQPHLACADNGKVFFNGATARLASFFDAFATSE